jgi:Zn-dependent peptidase ImmA (M78 family)/transcriptional regulator with XRE-family HTH domain
MLTLAREFHGMTMQELSDKIGTTASYVSQLEGALKEPSEHVLEKLVTVLKFPEQHYYSEGRCESAHPSFYRRRIVIPPMVLRQCSARMTIVKRNIEKMLAEVDAMDIRLPFIDPDECAGGTKEVAKRMRIQLRLPPGPIQKLTEILEEAGIIIIPFDFGTRKIDACTEWVSGRPVIFVNKFISASRLRHTLSHELGHVVMHKFITEESEQQADHFAAEFNLPEDDIKHDLLPMSIDRLARLKLKWKSSMGAILYRAESLGVITQRNARYYWMLMRRYRYHELEPHEDMMPVERPTALQELVDAFKQALKQSEDEVISFLAVFEDFYNEVYEGRPILKVA